MRVRGTASLLGPAARGALRLLIESALATPRRVYIGAGVAAIVAGIGASAVLLQIGPHPAPATHDLLPASAHAAAPTPISDSKSTASTTVRPEPRAPQASAPDITSSIEPATQNKPDKSSPPESVPRRAALAPDGIGALLGGKPDDGSRLVRAAQIALAKLGYAVKPSGGEDGATRRALRHFERAHGLAPTTEISSELVKQLTAAAGR